MPRRTLQPAAFVLAAALSAPVISGAGSETVPAARENDADRQVEEPEATDETATAPIEGKRHEERVSVTAEVRESASAPLGASSTVLLPDRTGGTPSNVTDVITRTAGVAQNGQGGHLQVFSIRGLSRRRVLNLVSGVRINSERRAGTSISWLDPLLLESAQVLRGPAMTLHGSGALGGVVQVTPRADEGWSLQAGYTDRGNENFQILGYGEENWSLGFARRDAGNAEAADGTELNSHFTQYSATVRGGWGKGPRRYALLYVPSRGENIGKANTDFPERTTTYPLERHQLLEFSVEAQKGWRARAWLHAHDLETEVVSAGVSRATVLNESLDYGLAWERDTKTGAESRIRWGVQLFGRDGVSAEESEETLGTGGSAGPVVRTLDDASEIEAGGFATYRRKLGRTEFEVGGRLSSLSQENAGDATRNRLGPSGFAGVTHRLGERLELRGSVSSGLRFPGLGEQFFNGTTGAGQILGNPELDPERSLNVETTARWAGQRLFVSGTVFSNFIDDFIQREPATDDPDGPLTFFNLGSGSIRGLELLGMFAPGERWLLPFGGQLMRGRDDDGERLADVPPDKIYLGFRHDRSAWSLGARLAYHDSISDPGPGEKAIPSALLLQANVDHRLSATWSVAFTAANLLDELYFEAPDRKAPYATGRNFGLAVVRRR